MEGKSTRMAISANTKCHEEDTKNGEGLNTRIGYAREKQKCQDTEPRHT